MSNEWRNQYGEANAWREFLRLGFEAARNYRGGGYPSNIIMSSSTLSHYGVAVLERTPTGMAWGRVLERYPELDPEYMQQLIDYIKAHRLRGVKRLAKRVRRAKHGWR